MKIIKKITAVVLAVSCLSSVAFAADEAGEAYQYVDKMFSYATELYIDENLDKNEVMINAFKQYLKDHPDIALDIIKDGFSSIDDYTEYYTNEEYSEYLNEINNTFYGIGVVITKNEDFIEITRVMDNSGASAAGLKIGDKISKVDGISVKNKSLDEVQKLIAGELGTTVDVTVIREANEYTYKITRQPIDDMTVEYTEFGDNVGYITVLNFALNTSDEFKEALDNFRQKGIYNIILDLRYNPGGYLKAAVEMAQMTVPEGIIIQTMYRQSEKNETYYSTLKKPEFKFAVLVNEYTASASEILTSAMQDSGIGTVIGETTFGKGIIQEMFDLMNTDSFKITTGKYLTRNGKEINNIGIEPDIYVTNLKEPVNVKDYPEIKYSNESKIGMANDNISAIKQRLLLMGYPLSDIDNVFDEELEAAILDFQISKGIDKTGRLDRITMVQIENAFADTEVTVDTQLYTAYELFGGTRDELEEILDNK